IGALVGFPALRVKGLYLALVTLGLAVIFPDIATRFVKGTGGTSLVALTSSELAAPSWFPSRLSAQDQFAYTMKDAFPSKPVVSPAVFGIALIVLMYVLPDGVVGGSRRLFAWSRRTLRTRRASPAAPATPATP